MAINYKIAKRAQAGVKGGGTPKYQAIVTGRNSINTRQLATLVSEECTLTVSDLEGALSALSLVIPRVLLKGYSVQFDNFGIFSVTLRSELCNSPEEVGLKSIKGLRVQFRADGEFKKGLGLYNLHKVNDQEK